MPGTAASPVCHIFSFLHIQQTNALQTALQADADGFPVGGASLKPEFVDIVNANWPSMSVEVA